MDEPTTTTPESQSAGAVLMVRPASFAFNPQTAPSNAFQAAPSESAQVQPLALREFDALADALGRAGVEVVIAQDTPSPAKPDAVFPNNWISFHGDGSVVLYPMLAPNRRQERREEILQQVAESGFRTGRNVDLSYRETHAQFLEGTGSLVLDRAHRIAYASLSPRTHLDVLGEFGQQLGYELVIFEAFDGRDTPVYHTNVLLAVGQRFAVVCSEAIRLAPQRAAVLGRLRATGHDVIEISTAQMQRFAGNCLELAPAAGNLIALSQSAWDSFEPLQRRRLEAHGGILAADISVIERAGGGSVRCMLAEIHLPKRRGPRMS